MPDRPTPEQRNRIVDAIRAVCAARPEHPAITGPDGVISYRRLAMEIDAVAELLRDRGVMARDGVSVMARRAAWLPVVVLAVWELGATAVLIDATLPPARVQAAERVVHPRWRVTADESGSLVAEAASTDAAPGLRGSHVLFTSGTTGSPAAVEIGGEALFRTLRWYVERFRPSPRCRVALIAGVGHDPVLRDMLVPLLTGGTLVVPPAGALDTPNALLDFLAGAALTNLHCTPPLLEFVLASATAGVGLRDVRLVVSSGAPLTVGIVRRLRRLTDAVIVNAYGTTETPQLVACQVVSDHPDLDDPVVPDTAVLGVGQGVAGAELLLEPRPGREEAGERGEIVVRSPHLALGYIGSSGPDGRFVPDRRRRPGMRAYRTGDLGERTADGGVRVIGRLDREVSVNGFRVALEEVEHAALRHPAVDRARAGLTTGRVGAFITLSVVPRGDASIDGGELRSFLRGQLPGHAVPTRVTATTSLVLDHNHKFSARPVLDVVEQPLTAAPADWDALAWPGDVDVGSSRCWNQTGSGDAHVLVRVARQPAAAAGPVRAVVPVFRYPAGPSNPMLHPASLFEGACLEGDRSPSAWEPVTIAGSALSGCITSPAATDVETWATTLPSGADPTVGTTVVPFVSDAVAARARHHLPGAVVLLTTLRAVLPVTGGSLAEHEAQLSRRKRVKMRYERRLLQRGNRQVHSGPLTDAIIEEIAPLQARTQARHGGFGDVGYWTRRYRGIVGTELAKSMVVFSCRHEGRMIGYSLGVVGNGVLTVQAAGLDYDRVGEHAEYFNLLVHEPVDYCLRHGLGGVDMGMGGLRQKVLRGGRLEPVWSLLLQSPTFWTAAAERRHNRNRAALFQLRYATYLSAGARERLTRMASTGVADFGLVDAATTDSA